MNVLKRYFFLNWKRATSTVLIILLGLYTLAGFIFIPWLVRPQIVNRLSALTDRPVRIDQIKLNPYSLSATVKGFEITDHDGNPLVSLESGFANLQLIPVLFQKEIHLKELRLLKPYSNTHINDEGHLNFADILENLSSRDDSEAPAQNDTRPYHLQVDMLSVTNGAIQFSDSSRSSHFKTTVSPINFEITDFHTGGKADAPYAFSATTESGEEFKWEGNVALEPLRSKGAFEARGLALSKYNPFYDIVLNLNITEGSIDVSGEYNYLSGDDPIAMLENGSLVIHNLIIPDHDGESILLSLEEGSIDGVNIDATTMNLVVQSVRFSNGQLNARRLKDGSMNLESLVKQTEEGIADGQDKAGPDSSERSPSYSINSIELDGFSIEFLDTIPEKPALLALDQLELSIQNLENQPGQESGISISTNIRSGGSIKSSGSFSLQPLGASIDINIAGIALSAGNPYLSKQADVNISDGTIDVTGRSVLGISENVPTGNFHGEIVLRDFRAVSSVDGSALTSLGLLGLMDIRAELNPASISIGSITIVDPRAEITILEDGTNTLANALRRGSKTPETTVAEEKIEKEESQPLLPFPVAIGSVTLENAGALLTDKSITPSVQLGLKTLSGIVEGLSSEELARADLDFTGELVGGTRLSMKGKINPLVSDQYSDMAITFTGFNLTNISPYSGKYAGYALSKGQLSFEMNYKVSHSMLSGQNVMHIDQLTLGEKVDSEEALNLPIPLAIALLKDKSGMIEIDVPVTGNLNDPEFSYGRVIGRAIINIITKVITSPFSMLANLASGDDDVDLSRIAFSPGSTDIGENSVKVLELLSQALSERPNIRLDITGTAGGAAEIEAVKLQQLNSRLQAVRLKELEDTGSTSLQANEIRINGDESARLIQILFNRTFPDEAVMQSTPVETEPESQSEIVNEEIEQPSPQKEPGIIKTIWRKIFPDDSEAGMQQAVATQDRDAATLPDSPEIPVMETSRPILTQAEMQERLLATFTVDPDDLQILATGRAEAVRRYLEEVGKIGNDRLFVSVPEDASDVHPETGTPQVVFSLE